MIARRLCDAVAPESPSGRCRRLIARDEAACWEHDPDRAAVRRVAADRPAGWGWRLPIPSRARRKRT